MAHQTKSFVKQHIDNKSHQRNKETFEKREAKRKASTAAECNVPAKMQRVTTLKQPLLAHVVNIAAAKYDIADETTTELFQNFPGSNRLLESSSKKLHILSSTFSHIFRIIFMAPPSHNPPPPAMCLCILASLTP